MVSKSEQERRDRAYDDQERAYDAEERHYYDDDDSSDDEYYQGGYDHREDEPEHDMRVARRELNYSSYDPRRKPDKRKVTFATPSTKHKNEQFRELDRKYKRQMHRDNVISKENPEVRRTPLLIASQKSKNNTKSATPSKSVGSGLQNDQHQAKVLRTVAEVGAGLSVAAGVLRISPPLYRLLNRITGGWLERTLVRIKPTWVMDQLGHYISKFSPLQKRQVAEAVDTAAEQLPVKSREEVHQITEPILHPVRGGPKDPFMIELRNISLDKSLTPSALAEKKRSHEAVTVYRNWVRANDTEYSSNEVKKILRDYVTGGEPLVGDKFWRFRAKFENPQPLRLPNMFNRPAAPPQRDTSFKVMNGRIAPSRPNMSNILSGPKRVFSATGRRVVSKIGTAEEAAKLSEDTFDKDLAGLSSNLSSESQRFVSEAEAGVTDTKAVAGDLFYDAEEEALTAFL
jgi:hypothetical protein